MIRYTYIMLMTIYMYIYSIICDIHNKELYNMIYIHDKLYIILQHVMRYGMLYMKYIDC